MKRLLQKELLRLLGWVLFGTLLGYLWDRPALGAATALLILLGQHIWQLQRLTRWLQAPHEAPPEAQRLWGEIFDGNRTISENSRFHFTFIFDLRLHKIPPIQ